MPDTAPPTRLGRVKPYITSEPIEPDGQDRSEKVVQGKIAVKKKSVLDKFSETFFGKDIKTVASYVLMDVLIPAAKNTISDMISTGVEMMLYGEPRGRRRGEKKGYVSYGSFFQRDSISERRPSYSEPRPEQYVLEDRADAEAVLERLNLLIEQYGEASVEDFYTMIGADSQFTDAKYGWTDLRSARVVGTREGYIVDLPRPRAL